MIRNWQAFNRPDCKGFLAFFRDAHYQFGSELCWSYNTFIDNRGANDRAVLLELPGSHMITFMKLLQKGVLYNSAQVNKWINRWPSVNNNQAWDLFWAQHDIFANLAWCAKDQNDLDYISQLFASSSYLPATSCTEINELVAAGKTMKDILKFTGNAIDSTQKTAAENAPKQKESTPAKAAPKTPAKTSSKTPAKTPAEKRKKDTPEKLAKKTSVRIFLFY